MESLGRFVAGCTAGLLYLLTCFLPVIARIVYVNTTLFARSQSFQQGDPDPVAILGLTTAMLMIGSLICAVWLSIIAGDN